MPTTVYNIPYDPLSSQWVFTGITGTVTGTIQANQNVHVLFSDAIPSPFTEGNLLLSGHIYSLTSTMGVWAKPSGAGCQMTVTDQILGGIGNSGTVVYPVPYSESWVDSDIPSGTIGTLQPNQDVHLFFSSTPPSPDEAGILVLSVNMYPLASTGPVWVRPTGPGCKLILTDQISQGTSSGSGGGGGGGGGGVDPADFAALEEEVVDARGAEADLSARFASIEGQLTGGAVIATPRTTAELTAALWDAEDIGRILYGTDDSLLYVVTGVGTQYMKFTGTRTLLGTTSVDTANFTAGIIYNGSTSSGGTSQPAASWTDSNFPADIQPARLFSSNLLSGRAFGVMDVTFLSPLTGNFLLYFDMTTAPNQSDCIAGVLTGGSADLLTATGYTALPGAELGAGLTTGNVGSPGARYNVRYSSNVYALTSGQSVTLRFIIPVSRGFLILKRIKLMPV